MEAAVGVGVGVTTGVEVGVGVGCWLSPRQPAKNKAAKATEKTRVKFAFESICL